MDNILSEELNNIKYLFGYKPGKVISEQVPTQANTSVNVPDIIKQIQTILNTKYGAKLNVDGKWGNLTQTALEQAMTKIKSGTATAPTTTAPVAAVTPTTTAPASPLTTAPTAPTAPVAAPIAATAPAKTPQEYYEQLVSMKLIDPVGGNRIVYKGEPPADNIKKAINDYLTTQGYTQKLEKNKNDGRIKLVYTK